MTRNRLVALSAVFVLALFPAFAAAQAPWGCDSCYGYGRSSSAYGYGYGYVRAVGYNAPPYFALHPPVYYSGEIVRRPYGSSPFAYPSWYERSAPAPQPQLVVNPHVRPDAAPVKAEVVDRGQKIENPYFVAK